MLSDPVAHFLIYLMEILSSQKSFLRWGKKKKKDAQTDVLHSHNWLRAIDKTDN